MQLSFFQPAPAVKVDAPLPDDVDRALVAALHLWYLDAVAIEPETASTEMPVTFPDGRQGRVKVWFVE